MDTSTPKQQRSYDAYIKLIQLVQDLASVSYTVGVVLQDIKDNKLYKYVGDGGFETWGRFLSQPEISISFSQAHTYIRVYEEFCLRLALQEDIENRPYSKLLALLPVISKMEENQAKEFYYAVINLGAKDFKEEVDKRRTKRQRKVVVKKCSVCDKHKMLLDNNDICHCVESQKK